MTKFTDWCEEKGYDPKGVFTVVGDKKDNEIVDGVKVTLRSDDYSTAPAFDCVNGEKDLHGDTWAFITFEGFLTQEGVPEETSFPAPPFKLSCGDDPAVRTWLKENGCTWASGDDLETFGTELTYLNIHEDFEVTWGNNSKFNYPELAVNIKPATVESWSLAKQELEQSSEKTALQEQAAKMQAELDEMNKRIEEMS